MRVDLQFDKYLQPIGRSRYFINLNTIDEQNNFK